MTVLALVPRVVCPRCGLNTLSPVGIAQGVRCRQCEWEGSSFMPPNARLQFRVDWCDDDPNTGEVHVILPADSPEDWPSKLGEVFWNGAEWWFIRHDKDGEIDHPMDNFIDVDPGLRMHLNDVQAENLKDRAERPEAVNEALDAALATRRREFRDDTRDLAELGAKMYARSWFFKWREL